MILNFQYLSNFFLLKNNNPYFVAVEFDCHENDHSHENKFSWGYLNTLTKTADSHDGVWSTHENMFS